MIKRTGSSSLRMVSKGELGGLDSGGVIGASSMTGEKFVGNCGAQLKTVELKKSALGDCVS